MMKSLTAVERFIHRDISWLNFNDRVLEEANDRNNPLLERLRFMAIYVNNLDEFFMIRVAGMKRLVDSGFSNKDEFGYLPQELLAEVKQKTIDGVRKAADIYNNKIRKELEKNNIFIKKFAELNDEQRRAAKKFFDKTLSPIMTPMAVDEGRPFPILPSKTVAFALAVIRRDEPRLTIIPVPNNVSRLFKLPSERNETCFILIEDIIRENLAVFFRGWKVAGATMFRVLRDSDIAVDEGFAPDLMHAIETEIKKRPKARVVSLEVEKGCDPRFLETICHEIEFPVEDVARVDGDFDLSYLFDLVSQTGNPELLFPPFVPVKINYTNIFDKISESDFVLHVPFQSFIPTVDLIHSAATDPNVLGIKMTLYRVNEDSGIIKALKVAAKNKKQVTVLVEIKARFDEERNITWARELEESGCHVIYGFAGMKIHSKIALIVRKEENNIRRYVHISTGNYNEKTARIYTDIGYFTANEDFARDISDVFNVITGYSLPARWTRIVSSPYDLRKYFFELIDQEIEFQKKYKNGAITVKLNSLEDPAIVDKLYEASSAGVRVRMVVRGICALVPGISEVSENIEVKSVVGRFLEHTRVFIFHNNSDTRVFLSSADWMRRNFDRRIELLFEVYKEDIKEHLATIMEFYWKDNAKSWRLLPDKSYVKVKPEKEKFNVQDALLAYYLMS